MMMRSWAGFPLRCVGAMFGAGVLSVLVGCSAMQSIEPTAEPDAVQGKVHGGQQAVVGAKVQLISIGTTGYGSGSTVLATATTDSNGNFTLPRPYTCPANSGLTILVATGGNAGGGTNSSIGEAAVTGQCSSLTANQSFFISEVTTVAAAYAIAPFATVTATGADAGTSTGNLLGLKNAAAAAGNLANVTTGQAGAANALAGAVLPTAEMNTLANILASCVNSGAGSVPSTTCSSLFTAATPPGGTAPTNTFAAAIDIALNPGNNAAALFALATPSAPFQPALTQAPGDFALGIIFNGGIIGTSKIAAGLDIDATGNAWVYAAAGANLAIPRGVVEISPAGAYLTPTSGYLSTALNGSAGLAINSSGNIEVVSFNSYQVYEITPTGGSNGGFSNSSASSFNAPLGIAINNADSSSWIVNYQGNTVTHINAAGAEMNGSPFAAGSYPHSVALDGSGDVWVTDSDNISSNGTNSAIIKYTPDGNGGYSAATFFTGTGTYPFDLALDHAGNVWTTQLVGVGENSNSGALLSPVGGYLSNPNNSPFGIQVDGLGRIIVSNSTQSDNQPGSLTVFSSTGTLISTANSLYGYTANGILPQDPYSPNGLALDASGNCWISGANPSEVVELIGIAAPVLTPLAARQSPNMLGVRP